MNGESALDQIEVSAIKIQYVSRWKPTKGVRFQLSGVIGVAADAVAAYAPVGSREAATLQELLREWETARAQWKHPLDWLTALAQSGNGITAEYSPVQELEVDAASLDQALRAAYQQVQQEYGKETTPKRVEGKIEIIRVGDWK